MRKRVNNLFLWYKSRAIVDWLNPSVTFATYLLSTRQQQVVDSAKDPPSPHRFLHFTNSRQSISRCKINAYPGISKRKQGLMKKNGNFPHTFRLSRWNIPDDPGKADSTLNARNFQIPLGGLAYETVMPKKYLIVTFRKSLWLKMKQFIKSRLDLIRSLL